GGADVVGALTVVGGEGSMVGLSAVLPSSEPHAPASSVKAMAAVPAVNARRRPLTSVLSLSSSTTIGRSHGRAGSRTDELRAGVASTVEWRVTEPATDGPRVAAKGGRLADGLARADRHGGGSAASA